MSVVLREVSKLNVQPQPLCNHLSSSSIYISLTRSFGLQNALGPTLAQITQAYLTPGVTYDVQINALNMSQTTWKNILSFYFT